MCVVIYPHYGNDSLQVVFVTEWIYQKRNGGRVATLDCLIHNTSDHPIDRFRIAYPQGLVEPTAIPRTTREWRLKHKVRRLQRRQLEGCELLTEELTRPDDNVYWPYTVLQHVRIDRERCSRQDGAVTIHDRFGIVRSRQRPDRPTSLWGYLKSNWTIQQPDDIDLYTWILHTLRGFVVLTVRAPGAETERIQPNEFAWFRFRLSVPPTGRNRVGVLERVFGRSREYSHTFMSPGEIAVFLHLRIATAQAERLTDKQAARPHLETARRTSLKLIPDSTPAGRGVGDWRCFLYREYGLALESTPVGRDGSYVLEGLSSRFVPRHAHPKGCAIDHWPVVVRRITDLVGKANAGRNARGSDRESEELIFEYWFGADHGLDPAATCRFDIRSRYSNRLYAYLAWLGLISFVLGVFNTLAAVFNWFR